MQRDFILFDNSSISAYGGIETSIKFRHVARISLQHNFNPQ